MLEIDYKAIYDHTGLSFDNMQDVFYYLLHHAEYLATHNKNYNKAQENRINDILNILECMEVK